MVVVYKVNFNVRFLDVTKDSSFFLVFRLKLIFFKRCLCLHIGYLVIVYIFDVAELFLCSRRKIAHLLTIFFY